MAPIIETGRLSLYLMRDDDAPFVCRLVNEPQFIARIGDKGVQTVADAVRYLHDVPMASYREYGYGGYLVRLRDSGERIGMCGLYRRSNLDHPDLGFAIGAAFVGKGYGFEAATGVIRYAQSALRIQLLAAITNPDNLPSLRLIQKLGFAEKGAYRMPGDVEDLRYFELSLQPER
ncbi:MAG: GNAT family N-acetyltransferase [Pseudomonadota bacterium]